MSSARRICKSRYTRAMTAQSKTTFECTEELDHPGLHRQNAQRWYTAQQNPDDPPPPPTMAQMHKALVNEVQTANNERATKALRDVLSLHCPVDTADTWQEVCADCHVPPGNDDNGRPALWPCDTVLAIQNWIAL